MCKKKENKIEQNKEKKGISFHRFWLIALVCLALWLGGLCVTHWYSNKEFNIPVVGGVENRLNNPGLLGDSAGVINALFSALALAGVILAVLMQSRELELQREEFKKTTEALENQKKEFVEQNKTLKYQQFDNTLFNMLSLQQQIVNTLSFKYKENVKEVSFSGGAQNKEVIQDRIIEGREMFRFAFKEEKHWVDVPVPEDKTIRRMQVDGMRNYLCCRGIDNYDHATTPTYFDHYFRHLYTIIKFIHEADCLETFEEKYKYTSMVRATLSRYELVWLFYNALSCVGNEKFKPLIERYSLLKNLRPDLLTLCKENRDLLLGKNMTTKNLQEKRFSGTDYEFFLTDQENDKNTFDIQAFYSKKEIDKGKRLVQEWKNLHFR